MNTDHETISEYLETAKGMPVTLKQNPGSLLQLLMDEASRLSPPIREWLEAAISDWIKGKSMDSALGLSSLPGQRRPATRLRVAMRDSELRRAWGLVDATSPWKRSVALAERIERLEPVYRGYKSGRPPTSAVNQRLCAARDWYSLPTTATRLHEICSIAS